VIVLGDALADSDSDSEAEGDPPPPPLLEFEQPAASRHPTATTAPILVSFIDVLLGKWPSKYYGQRCRTVSVVAPFRESIRHEDGSQALMR
jgi:hypothetical protein